MDDNGCAPLSAPGASEHVGNLGDYLFSNMSTSTAVENPSLVGLPSE